MIAAPVLSQQVSLSDLKAQTRSIREEIDEAIASVLNDSSFILGREVEQLEQKIAELCGCKAAAAVASGTDALLLSLKACGIGGGDEVITTAYSCFATAGPVHHLAGRPVFVDVEPDTYNTDACQIEDRITSRTKAVIAVHLFGQCADLKALATRCVKNGLFLIEDAAQAIGARQRIEGVEQVAGSVGLCGCLSFFPTKNLGGFGDGGMVVSNDPYFIEEIKMLRAHGSSLKYHNQLAGYNSRLDTIQAAVLLVKLRYLANWIKRRREAAEIYRLLIKDAGLDSFLELPAERPENVHTYNQFVIQCRHRDELQLFLDERTIATDVFYPLPLHLQKCFEYLGYDEGDFPVAERLSKTTLALPIYPEITLEQQEYVINTIGEFYSRGAIRFART